MRWAPPGELLSTEDVGGALGVPVTARLVAEATPVTLRTVRFSGADGQPVLELMSGGGVAGQVAVRVRHRSEPLPGIGDEAYAGRGWAVGRRGDEAVLLSTARAGHGHDQDQAAGPEALRTLLSGAIDRLPAQPSGL